MSTSFDDAFGGGSGTVLIALTKPYAAMVGPALSRLRERQIERMRIFGWRLKQVLPRSLHGSVMDYDDRLEAVLPGTRSDFPQRALLHFVETVLPNGAETRDDGKAVEEAMSGLVPRAKVKRPRASDADISAWLAGALSEESGIGRLLRRFRAEGVACEQARFTRLYHQVLESREAA